MGGSRDTANLSKDDKVTTPATDQGEEGGVKTQEREGYTRYSGVQN